MSEANIPFDESRVLYDKPETASGEQLARVALSLKPRPTALFATNNFLTIGAFTALRAAGLQIPADISLAGFDDLPDSLILDPFLTVARQPAYEMGRRGAEMLLARLAGAAPQQVEDVVLPTDLVVRRSTAAPRGSAESLRREIYVP